MAKTKTKEFDIALKKQQVSQAHIQYYDKLLDVLSFILDEYSREIIRTDIDFLEIQVIEEDY